MTASVSFATSSLGWVLGTAPCAAEPCTSLLRTTDDGLEWVGIPAPAAQLANPLSLHAHRSTVNAVMLANSRDGYVYGPGLWVTHDGGWAWQRISEVAGISAFYVASMVTAGSSVYALVSNWDTGASGVGGRGGHTRLVRAPVGSEDFTVLDDFGPHSYLSQPLVASGSTVYVLEPAGLVRVQGTALTTQTLPPGCPGQLAASSPTNLLFVCGEAAGQGSFGTREVYGSTNSGNTWTRLNNPGQGYGYDPDGVAAASEGHAVIGTVSGGGSGLLVTTDYARTWAVRLGFNDAATGFTDLAFQSASQAVVVHDPQYALEAQYGTSPGPIPVPSPATLWMSSDAAVSWHRVTFG